MKIRQSHPTEADQYSTFAKQIFITTYSPHNPKELLDRHVRTRFSPALQQHDLDDPDRIVLVIEGSGNSWAGFAIVKKGNAPEQVIANNPAEIERFYIDVPLQGTGAAAALMAECIERATANGHDALWLCAWMFNTRARKFYAKQGFREIGTMPFDFGGEIQEDALMVREIGTR